MTKTHTVKNNPFIEYLEAVESSPSDYPKEIVQQCKLQREMLKKFDFIEQKGKSCVDWIEKFCVLTEGENAGDKVKLMLWQKWVIYSIFCFYGNLKVEEFDEKGKFVGLVDKYVRIVNDVLIFAESSSAISINSFFDFALCFPPIFIGIK